MKIKFLTLVLCSMVGLSACQTLPSVNPTNPPAVDAQPAIFIPKTPTFKDLQSYHWKLMSVNDDSQAKQVYKTLQPLADKDKVTLDFNGNRMHYSLGCNQLSSNVSLTGKTLQAKGNTASTLMACGDLQAAETLLAEKIQGTSEVVIDSGGTSLQQKIEDDVTFNWVGTLKPDVKYGKGETLFLEVKPNTKPCDKLTNKQCLEVREIVYNAEGLKTTTGQWRLLSQPIQGFQLTPNTQQIIRVNRYRTPPSDTMGYGHTYVLDTVIESQLIK